MLRQILSFAFAATPILCVLTAFSVAGVAVDVVGQSAQASVYAHQQGKTFLEDTDVFPVSNWSNKKKTQFSLASYDPDSISGAVSVTTNIPGSYPIAVKIDLSRNNYFWGLKGRLPFPVKGKYTGNFKMSVTRDDGTVIAGPIFQHSSFDVVTREFPHAGVKIVNIRNAYQTFKFASLSNGTYRVTVKYTGTPTRSLLHHIDFSYAFKIVN